MGDRRHVQQQVGGAAERRVRDHRVAQRRLGQDVASSSGHAPASVIERARRTARHVEPDRLAGRRQRRVAQRHARAPRRRPATSPPCRETGSHRRVTRTRGIRDRPPAPARDRRARSGRRSSGRGPASSASVGSSVTPPGTSTHGRSRVAASAIIIAGSPLSQVATPSTPLRVGSDRISRRKIVAASLRYGRLSNIAGVPCDRPSHGSVHDAANGIIPARENSAGRRLHQQADFPVTGVIPERDRRAVGRADAAVGREHQELAACRAPTAFQPMPAFWVQPNRSPDGRSRSICGVSGSEPDGPGRVRQDVEE